MMIAETHSIIFIAHYNPMQNSSIFHPAFVHAPALGGIDIH